MTSNVQVEGALRDLASRRVVWFLIGILVGMFLIH